jgi:hypothetical protein
MGYISAKPYVRSIEFVTKEAAKPLYGDGNENWTKFWMQIPFPTPSTLK